MQIIKEKLEIDEVLEKRIKNTCSISLGVVLIKIV